MYLHAYCKNFNYIEHLTHNRLKVYRIDESIVIFKNSYHAYDGVNYRNKIFSYDKFQLVFYLFLFSNLTQ